MGSSQTTLYVRDLSVENANDGVQANGPYVSVESCEFRGCEQGLDTLAWQGTVVRNCRFYGSQCMGVMVFGGLGATNVLVENCQFEGGLGGVDLQSQDSVVRSCTFEDLRVGLQLSFGATASIESCSFEGMESYGLVLTGGSSGLLLNNSVGACPVNLAVFNEASCTGSGNILEGGTFRTIDMSSYPTSLEMRDSHILNGGGEWTFFTGSAVAPMVVDLRNNWWGTTDPAQIDAWTRDASDGAMNVNVLYEPFYGMPVRTESTSFGRLKSLFGDANDDES